MLLGEILRNIGLVRESWLLILVGMEEVFLAIVEEDREEQKEKKRDCG